MHASFSCFPRRPRGRFWFVMDVPCFHPLVLSPCSWLKGLRPPSVGPVLPAAAVARWLVDLPHLRSI